MGPAPFSHSDLSQTQFSPSSPVNCLIDKSRLSTPEHEARFILNPEKNGLVQAASVCD